MSFTTVETIIRREIEKALTERLEALMAQLASGAIHDMENYRFVTGQMKALQDVRAWLTEAEGKVLGVDG